MSPFFRYFYSYSIDATGKKVSTDIYGVSYYRQASSNIYSAYEQDGNILINGGEIVDETGKCNNPCMVVCACDKFSYHIVYERGGDIYYSTGCPYDFVNINISNNEGHSSNPSIALDEYYRPHILWTDETPGKETEIIYTHLDCAWLHGGE